jgi:hypothetical protein
VAVTGEVEQREDRYGVGETGGWRDGAGRRRGMRSGDGKVAGQLGHKADFDRLLTNFF